MTWLEAWYMAPKVLFHPLLHMLDAMPDDMLPACFCLEHVVDTLMRWIGDTLCLCVQAHCAQHALSASTSLIIDVLLASAGPGA